MEVQRLSACGAAYRTHEKHIAQTSTKERGYIYRHMPPHHLTQNHILYYGSAIFILASSSQFVSLVSMSLRPHSYKHARVQNKQQ